MKILENLKYVLGNESGGPNLEELIGIAYGLAVGSGLFVVGKEMVTWLKKASSSISAISSAVPT